MKRKDVESLFMLGYRKGIEEARRELEQLQKLDAARDQGFKAGQRAEAARNGDTKRVLDLNGGAQ